MADPGVEGRLSAIMVADVVGYSRLFSADEGTTLADPEVSFTSRHPRGLLLVVCWH